MVFGGRGMGAGGFSKGVGDRPSSLNTICYDAN